MTKPLQPSTSSSLATWLTYLEQLHTSEIDLGLARVGVVAQRLKLPLTAAQLSTKVITLAGTNGKGSTLTFLQSIALAQGLKVGSYTSPHFLKFNERIQLNGLPVTDAQIIAAFNAIEAARLIEPAISLSYFEFATLAGLVIFAQQEELDLILLEVGLGGRLDAVNLVDADLSIVVTVAQDHADYLGTDLNAIGFEKAGIFRAHQPVVLGSAALPPSVLAYAQKLNCPVKQLHQDFTHQPNANNSWSWHGQGVQQEALVLNNLPPSNLPRDNAATAIQALQILYGSLLTPKAIQTGIAQAKLTGRMQRLGAWLLDVAHNPAAAEYLAQQLSQAPAKQRLGYLGMLSDKDIIETVKPLLPWVQAWVVTCLPGPRAKPAQDLAQVLTSLGAQVIFTATEGQETAALAFAQAQLHKGYTEVLAVGSFLTLAQVLAHLDYTSN